MSRNESGLDNLRDELLKGHLTRRQVLRRAAALGLSAPVIAGLLAACGGDDGEDTEETEATSPAGATAAESETTPTEASGGGATTTTEEAEEDGTPTEAATEEATEATTGGATTGGRGRGVADLLRILYWQAPTILNPHFSQGNKDSSAANLILEPLIDIDAEGNLIPVLVAEIPSLENGMVAEDGMSVTYTLKEGVVWSDGEPFTAEDVRFTWQFITDPTAATTTFATYENIADVVVEDPLTVTIQFSQPAPGWYEPFATGFGGQILPRHILEGVTGTAARDSEFNLSPIGTGPYKLVEFRAGDLVSYEVNENYREADKPYFQRVEIKGGGDATAAARAALQSGETDYAWNLQVEKAILDDLADSDIGDLLSSPGAGVERIVINFADPNTEVDGARSEPSTQHPFLQFKEVRQAFAMATDRESIANELYGPSGTATANLLVAPERFASPNTSFEFDVEGAAAMLEEAGWTGDPRSKDGVEMSVVYKATVNPVRQKTQEICKQAWESLGIPTEIRAIDAGVFFSSDPGNLDTYSHFYADFQMDTNGPSSPYPISYLALYKSDNPDVDIAQKSNQWSGLNANRWVNEEYNELYQQALTELDPDRQAELFIAMNDLLVNEVVDIALVHRASVSAASKKLKGFVRSPWSPDVHDIANWYFEE